MTRQLPALATLLGGLLLATASEAAIISSWNMTGQAGNQASSVATTEAVGVSGSLLSRGAGLTATAAANSLNSSGWNAQATDYVSFTFAIASGLTLALDNLVIGTQSSATGPGTMGLFYSGDNFTTALATLTQPSASLLSSTLALASLVSLSGNVEFRLAQIGTLAPNGSATAAAGTFRVANHATLGAVTFNGTLSSTAPSAVPLPPALALLGLGLAGMGFGGRRRRSQDAALAA